MNLMDITSAKPADTCRWFAFCSNHAVVELPHPVLPPVPTCDRCLGLTMERTVFDDYDGVYTAPIFMWRLMWDLNAGMDDGEKYDDFVKVLESWEIPIGDILCIEGQWKDVGYGASGDPTLPDWSDLGIDTDFTDAIRGTGVFYSDHHMVIAGYNGMMMCFWIFKEAS